jgi:HK97 family phage major capsid protein
MTNTRINSSPILTPEEINTGLLNPVEAGSIATRVATVVRTASPSYRLPMVAKDPTAAWVAEGEEIPLSDAQFDEEIVEPTKVAGITVVTRELAEDSSPEAVETIGRGLARDIALKVDAAFFGDLPAPAAAGLGSLTTGMPGDVQALSAGAAFDNLDVFAAAQSAAAEVGAALTSFVANPADALALARLKESEGSNRPLLGSDPTQPTQRLIGGVPLIVSSAVPAGTIWGLPQNAVYVVIREDADIVSDDGKGQFFTSDRVAIKATMRVGFGFPQRSAIVKIMTTDA